MDGGTTELRDNLSTGLSANLKIYDENPTHIENDVQKTNVDDYYVEEDEDGLSEDALLAQMGYAKSDEEDQEEKDFSEEEILAQMGYAETQPKRKTVNEIIEKAFLAQMSCLNKEPSKHEPITTPTSELKLVSAFKGSRENDGTSSRERRVTWDPDVYDPYPTYAELLVACKNDGHKDDMRTKGFYGKNKQKDGGRKAGGREGEEGEVKGKRGGGSKGKTAGKNKDKIYGDKKQGKKRGGGGSGSKKNLEFGEF